MSCIEQLKVVKFAYFKEGSISSTSQFAASHLRKYEKKD